MPKQIGNPPKEVDVIAPPHVYYRLVSVDLLRTLMERTGDGARVSIRNLADSAGCHHNTINALLQGRQNSVPMEVAHGICDRLGVGVLVLFAPPHLAALRTAMTAITA